MSMMSASMGELVGDSPAIVALREEVRRLLGSLGTGRLPPVLIEGETGTGKGLLARLLHRGGPRAAGPFVAINCAAIPETLLESEMFGYERGAFTDARQPKSGLLEAAQQGTFFLDEVGLLPEGVQGKLLKAIEDREVRRLGATRSIPLDVWIIAATSEDLATARQAGRFQEALYHRLSVLTFRLPALRTRGDDVVLLAERFLARACAEYGLGGKRLGDRRAPAPAPVSLARQRARARERDGAGRLARRGGDRGGGAARARAAHRPAAAIPGAVERGGTGDRRTGTTSSRSSRPSSRRAGTSPWPRAGSGSPGTPSATASRSTGCAPARPSPPRRGRPSDQPAAAAMPTAPVEPAGLPSAVPGRGVGRAARAGGAARDPDRALGAATGDAAPRRPRDGPDPDPRARSLRRARPRRGEDHGVRRAARGARRDGDRRGVRARPRRGRAAPGCARGDGHPEGDAARPRRGRGGRHPARHPRRRGGRRAGERDGRDGAREQAGELGAPRRPRGPGGAQQHRRQRGRGAVPRAALRPASRRGGPAAAGADVSSRRARAVRPRAAPAAGPLRRPGP